MSEKKEQPRKKKIKQQLSQKEKFIEYAKQTECDETGETFDTVIKNIVHPSQNDNS